MKVWITKYALTRGIVEAEANAPSDRVVKFPNGKILYVGHSYADKKEAIQKADEMRVRKIASLKKQIEKLEKMKFE